MVFLTGFAIAFGATIQFKFWKASLNIKPESTLDFAEAAGKATTPEQINDVIRNNPGGAVGNLEFLRFRVLIRSMLSSMDRQLSPNTPQGDDSLSLLAKRVCESGAISLDLNKKLVRFASATHFVEWSNAPQQDPMTLKVWQEAAPGLVSDLAEQETKLIRGGGKMNPNSGCVQRVKDIR